MSERGPIPDDNSIKVKFPNGVVRTVTVLAWRRVQSNPDKYIPIVCIPGHNLQVNGKHDYEAIPYAKE